MDFSTINWLALAVATVAAYALGALWYSPILFGKNWQKEVGLSEDDLMGVSMGKMMLKTFIITFIMALGVGFMIYAHGDGISSWQEGLHHGLYAGVFFAAMSMALNYTYQQKSLKLWAIDSGYQVLFLGLIGAILGAW